MAFEDYEGVIHRCFRCGFCKLTYDYSPLGYNCPMYHRFRLETYSPGGVMWLINASLMRGDIQWTDHLSEILYSCSMCGNCVEQCRFEFGKDLMNIFKAVRGKVVAAQLVPPMVGQFLENVYTYGNPYKELRDKRGDWAEGMGIKPYGKGDEFLYYVGCVGSYDTCSQRAARALGNVLLKSGLSFGILGDKEDCDGNEVQMLGEKGLFELQRERNIQMFKDLGVKRIVTLSPHSYNAMKNNYLNQFEVFHYTQLVRDLIQSGELDVSKGLEARVTYHDSCFLGRHNGEYDAPRQILRAIPGIQLVEMERSRNNAFCCGGGGGNFYTGISAKGKDQASIARVREAYDTGANILAVACPICMMMLEDAVKSEELEEWLAIKDISEIVLESHLL